MNLQHHYWYFEKAIPDHACDGIIKHALQKKDNLAVTGTEQDKLKKGESLKDDDLKSLISTKRNSNVVWLEDQWIYDLILPYVRAANENAGWNFDFDWSESCQFTIYKENQYYGWHCDSHIKPYTDGNLKGKVRKLSVTVSLNDGSEYEGGELEFDFRNGEPEDDRTKLCTEIYKKGSIVVFPSFVWHRVKPVVEGTRYSLVIWNCGYPFK